MFVRRERIGGSEKVKSIALAVLTALILTGCATIESLFFPTPPPKAPAPPPPPPVKRVPTPPPPKKEPEPLPAAKEPEIPPPVLAPQVGDEEQLKREAGSRIQRTEQLIGQLEEKKLTEDQKEQLLTIRSLLGNAKEAFATKDLAKASNLADKARVLGEELARGIR